MNVLMCYQSLSKIRSNMCGNPHIIQTRAYGSFLSNIRNTLKPNKERILFPKEIGSAGESFLEVRRVKHKNRQKAGP